MLLAIGISSVEHWFQKNTLKLTAKIFNRFNLNNSLTTKPQGLNYYKLGFVLLMSI